MMGPVEDTYRLAGRVVAERYAVERAVARGGFGLVYRASHTGLGTPVALKVLTPPEHQRADAAMVERFRQEARTLAALQHPAIVRVLDVGALDADEGPRVWMALEWLDGVTLEHDLEARAGRGRSPREVLATLSSALDGVACAHARGVAHRDLKPANLMLTAAARGAPSLRVLDFGIAKEMLPDEAPGSGHTATRSDAPAFSLAYAAPEQVSRARTGPWTDVHALGLIAAEMLLGRRAYPGDDSFALYAAIMAAERPTPARGDLDVGPWEPVLRKALALRPDDRYPSAGALRDALAATVDDAQRAWERPPAPPRARRRYAPLAVAALGLPAIVIALGWRAPVARPALVSAAPAPVPSVAPPVVAPPVVAPPVVAAPVVAAPVVAIVDAAAPVDATVAAGLARRAQGPRRPVTRARDARGGDSDPEVVVE